MAGGTDDVALHRRGHEAFGRGDVEVYRELIAPDSVWHISGRGPLAGDYRGRQEVFSYLEGLQERSGGALQLEDEDFLQSEDHTMALSRLRATRGDDTLDVRMCEIVRWRDGQVAEVWAIFEDQYAADAFWSGGER